MINLIFSMNGPRLNEEQSGKFSAFAQWLVLNERNGKLLVDGVGAQENVSNVIGILQQMGRAPKVIGAWNMDGALAEGYALDNAAWVEVAPDVIVDEVAVRPTEFSEIHSWGGWAPKNILE